MPPRARFRFIAVILFALAVIAVLLAGRSAWDSSRVVPERGGTYVEAMAGRPQYINPLLAQFNEIDRDLVSLVFAGLVKVGEDGRLAPDLAEEWEVSPDGMVYTFRLRDDRNWHNGQPVGVADVLFTVRLLQDPKFPGLPDLAAPWREVKASKVDERTVRFALAEPYGAFLEQCSIGILPAHMFGTLPAEELTEHPFNGFPIGAGPFKVSQVSVQQVTLVPDPDYPGPKPYLQSMSFRFYPSTRAALTALLQGEAMGVRNVPPEEVASLRQDQRLTVLSAPQVGRASVLFLNARRPPFDDPLVRRALALAVDRTALIDEGLAGQGRAAHGPLNPLSWGYRAQSEVGHDLDEARALLERAGWVEGDGDRVREKGGEPLAITIATSDAPERRRAAEVLAAQVGKAGFRVEVDALTWEELRDDHLALYDFTAALAEVWLPNRDPDVSVFWHSAQAEDGFNFAGWRDGRADDLLLKGRQAAPSPARDEIYAEFQALFEAEAPAVFLYYPAYTYVLSADVKGARLGMLLDPADRFRFFDEWYTRTKRLFF